MSLLAKLLEVVLAKLGNLWSDHDPAIPLVGVVFEVSLVVIFSFVKYGKRHKLRDDRFSPNARIADLLHHLFRNPFLLWSVVENYRAILCPHIRPLPIESGRIVYGEKDIKYLSIRDCGRIKRKLHRFSVAGIPGTYLLIGRIGYCPSRITRFDLLYPLELGENSFSTPKTSTTEGREFKIAAHFILSFPKVCINH